MDIKNRQIGVLERTSPQGGEVVLFNTSTFATGLGKERPFIPTSAVEKFLTHPVVEAPSVALKIIDKKDPTVLPDILSQIDQIRATTHAEDAIKLEAVREELGMIKKGIKP